MGSVCVPLPYELEHPDCRPAGDLFCLPSYPCHCFYWNRRRPTRPVAGLYPRISSSGWRRHRLLPHGGNLPRAYAALAAPILPHGTQMDGISRSLTAVSFSFLYSSGRSLFCTGQMRRRDQKPFVRKSMHELYPYRTGPSLK